MIRTILHDGKEPRACDVRVHTHEVAENRRSNNALITSARKRAHLSADFQLHKHSEQTLDRKMRARK
jgi:hypothetical protein